MDTVQTDLIEFVQSLPKTETHLHLDGCVSFDQLHAFDPVRYPSPPAFWDKAFRFRDFEHFQREFDEWIIPYHHSLEHYHETAKHVFSRCAEQGCRYVEASFHLPVVDILSTSGPDLIDAILDGAPDTLAVRLFGGMCHNDYQPHRKMLHEALSWEGLSGIDLHGPEYWPVDPGIPGYWHAARDSGKVTKAHAGEFMPASFVEWVLDHLEVDRIQHGVRSVEDANLVQRMVDRGTPLDMCPISNFKLGVRGVDSMSNHPIRTLFDAGAVVTVSTDDTFLFGNSLLDEYVTLALETGFTKWELVEIARYGFKVALLDEEEKATITAELDCITADLPGPRHR